MKHTHNLAMVFNTTQIASHKLAMVFNTSQMNSQNLKMVFNTSQMNSNACRSSKTAAILTIKEPNKDTKLSVMLDVTLCSSSVDEVCFDSISQMQFLCFCSSEAFSVQRRCENASSNSHYQPTFGYTCACITYIHF